MDDDYPLTVVDGEGKGIQIEVEDEGEHDADEDPWEPSRQSQTLVTDDGT